MAIVVFYVWYAQNERAELKAATRKIGELQRIRETHLKQVQYLNQTHQELAKEKDELNVEFNAFKNG